VEGRRDAQEDQRPPETPGRERVQQDDQRKELPRQLRRVVQIEHDQRDANQCGQSRLAPGVEGFLDPDYKQQGACQRQAKHQTVYRQGWKEQRPQCHQRRQRHLESAAERHQHVGVTREDLAVYVVVDIDVVGVGRVEHSSCDHGRHRQRDQDGERSPQQGG